MKILIDLKSISGYRQFLAIKGLPRYRFVGREAEFPDEYASILGLAPATLTHNGYAPLARLFDYQKDVSRLAIRKQKYATFIDPGFGKTLIMYEFCRHVSAMFPDHCVLMVSPLMVIKQTIAEGEKFYGDTMPVKQIRAAGLQEWFHNGNGIGITNYEAIRDGLRPGKLICLALDESSMLKSAYGKWGTRLIELGRGLAWKLALTGTPAPNDRVEYANHALFLDQVPNVNSFLARYFVNEGKTGKRWKLKSHALRAFYQDLSHWCIFMTNPATYGWKDNVGTIPPIRTHILDVPMTDDQWQQAQDVSGNMFGIAGGIGSRSKIARIAKGVGAQSHKPAFLSGLINSSKDPCLVWCRYNPEQDALAKLLPRAANIDGRTKEQSRIDLIEGFKSGRYDTLLSKAKILGFGMNLQRAKRQVFSTLMDSYEDYFQCVKRSNRVGSTHPLDVYIPVTEIERPFVDNVLAKCDRVLSDTREQELLFKEVGYVLN